MSKLRKVHVKGLFGTVDHDVALNTSGPTVITGPNGTGKTHVLQLVNAAVNGYVEELLRLPFSNIELKFDDRLLSVAKDAGDRGDARVTITLEPPSGESVSAWSSAEEIMRLKHEREHDQPERRLPRWIIQLESGAYYDTRAERIVASKFVEQRYGRRLRGGSFDTSEDGSRLLTALNDVRSVMVDTKRLDSDADYQDRRHMAAGPTTRGDARILRYIKEIQGEIASARDTSLHKTQSADLRFADRALAAATLTVRVDDLRARYAEVAKLYEEMARNGLAPDETPTDLPEKPNPTARRILSLLLQDWQDRLEPLIPINTKLNELRSIIDSRLEGSGKRTYVGPNGRLGIRSFNGRPIPVARLSSGEQHLLAIFSQLLFATRPGSLVLIDEPEISMHMSWQHSFLDDVSKVAQGSNLQIIVATHSTGIINGRWDLVEELSLPALDEDKDVLLETLLDDEVSEDVSDYE